MSEEISGKARGAVIFDRDEVLNVDIGYPYRPDQIIWIEGAMAAVKAVNDAGLWAFVATNQSGVALGLYGETDVVALHNWMNGELAKAGAHIDALAYCPHHPEGKIEAYRRVCDCRKPGAGMLNQLLDDHGADRSRSAMVGDRDSDMQAAQAAGIEGLLFKGGDLSQAVAPLIARLTR